MHNNDIIAFIEKVMMDPFWVDIPTAFSIAEHPAPNRSTPCHG